MGCVIFCFGIGVLYGVANYFFYGTNDYFSGTIRFIGEWSGRLFITSGPTGSRVTMLWNSLLSIVKADMNLPDNLIVGSTGDSTGYFLPGEISAPMEMVNLHSCGETSSAPSSVAFLGTSSALMGTLLLLPTAAFRPNDSLPSDDT